MTAAAGPSRLAEPEVARLVRVPAGEVDLRRDLYQFIAYVRRQGLTRTVRENAIPKSAARALAKLLSREAEAAAVEQEGAGDWSDFVSWRALELGLVKFDTKGEYRGYSSTEPSFVDNQVHLVETAWLAYLAKTPCQKEWALLEKLLELPGNEFFSTPTLLASEGFSSWGCARGPASRMKLPKLRRTLLALLAGLEPGVWYEMSSFVDWLRETQPRLILDPATLEPDDESRRRLQQWEWEVQNRKHQAKYLQAKPGPLPPKPELELEDLYSNFREYPASERYHDGDGKRPEANTQAGYQRVEGRYLERFLSELPYVAGFVELAFRPPTDSHGLNVSPPFERLVAFRLTPRFFQVWNRTEELDRVSVRVLPNFEVLVEAPSYPERQLESLEPYTVLLQEDGPIHRLRLDRKKLVAHAALTGTRPAAEVLTRLTGGPLPGNVASELASWSGHAEKLTFYEGLGLLELPADKSERELIRSSVAPWTVDEGPDGFLLLRKPDEVFPGLEQGGCVPVRVSHPAETFRSCPGRLGSSRAGSPAASRAGAAKGKGGLPGKLAPLRVTLELEDLAGYRCPELGLLEALHEALKDESTNLLLPKERLLLVSSSAMPKVRALLKRLSDRYTVETR
jgi:hypothetical protein